MPGAVVTTSEHGNLYDKAHSSWLNAARVAAATEREHLQRPGRAANGRGATSPLMCETPRHDTSSDMNACDDCHKGDLTFEHEGRTDSTGAAMTCETCHGSTDCAGRRDSLRRYACASCTRSIYLSAHVSATNSGCFGVGCTTREEPREGPRLYAHGSENRLRTSCAFVTRTQCQRGRAGANGKRCTGVCTISTHSQYSTGHASTSASSGCTKSECHRYRPVADSRRRPVRCRQNGSLRHLSHQVAEVEQVGRLLQLAHWTARSRGCAYIYHAGWLLGVPQLQ